MAVKWINIYREQFRSIERLSNEQAGILLKGLVQFANTGKFPSGLELAIDILLDEMTSKIGRDIAIYEQKCEKMKSNARKRWEASDAIASDGIPIAQSGMQLHAEASQQNAIACNSTQLNPTTNKTQPISTSTSTPLISDEDAHQIRMANQQVMDAAFDAGFDRSMGSMNIIHDLINEFGHKEVIAGIKVCVQQGVAKIAYLRKVLGNKRDGVAKPQTIVTKSKRIPSEAAYEQREYKPGDAEAEFLAEIQRHLAEMAEQEKKEDEDNDRHREDEPVCGDPETVA